MPWSQYSYKKILCLGLNIALNISYAMVFFSIHIKILISLVVQPLNSDLESGVILSKKGAGRGQDGIFFLSCHGIRKYLCC